MTLIHVLTSYHLYFLICTVIMQPLSFLTNKVKLFHTLQDLIVVKRNLFTLMEKNLSVIQVENHRKIERERLKLHDQNWTYEGLCRVRQLLEM